MTTTTNLTSENRATVVVAGVAACAAVLASVAVLFLGVQVKANGAKATSAQQRAGQLEERVEVLRDDMRTLMLEEARLRALLLATGVDPGPPPPIGSSNREAPSSRDAPTPAPSPSPTATPAVIPTPRSRSSLSPCPTFPITGRCL